MTPIWARLDVEALLTQFVSWLPRLLSAIVLLFIFWLVWRFTRPILLRVLYTAGLDHTLASMVLSLYRFTLWVFAMIMACNQVGINVEAALTGLGVVGLTIGFAARDSLSNVMAGFLILWDKPFHAGDWVTLGDQFGRVEEITMRTTRLLTRKNTLVIIPNQNVINQVVVNHSSNGKIQIEVPIPVSPTRDVSAVREAIAEVVRGIDGVLKDPPANVVVKALDSRGVVLLVCAWISKAEDELPIRWKILEASKPLVRDAEEAA